MTVTVQIPDALIPIVESAGSDPSRAFLEAFALDGYRSMRLTEYQVRQLLGFHTCDETHGFFKRNGVFLHYSIEDAEEDLAAASRFPRPAD
jgi:hypothetical protein